MTITRLKLKNFTAFESLDFKPSPGINIFIGANGTGKTHLMKVLYAACDITKSEKSFSEKIVQVFLPSGRALGRLVKRQTTSSTAEIEVSRGRSKLHLSFSSHMKAWNHEKVKTTGTVAFSKKPLESVFIPVKEMLANGPGFRSLYALREVHFEEIYADILDRAYLPALKGPKDPTTKALLKTLQGAMEGKVTQRSEEFFLKNKQGNLEFTLLAEGIRKLGLLWLLIQNGVLVNGSVLFWDEPETNLNPKLFTVVVELLLQLQRIGVQIFISTHDYSILKEFEVAAIASDQLLFGALYRPVAGASVILETRAEPFKLENSSIEQAMTSLYDREIKRSLSE